MTAQRVSAAAGWVASWKLESVDSGKEYKVSKRADGSFGCSCQAWKFAKAPKPDCKHIEALKEQLNYESRLRNVKTEYDVREAGKWPGARQSVPAPVIPDARPRPKIVERFTISPIEMALAGAGKRKFRRET